MAFDIKIQYCVCVCHTANIIENFKTVTLHAIGPFATCTCIDFLTPWKFQMLYCHLLNDFKMNFLDKSFRITIRVAYSLDPNKARHFVGPDLGSNLLERLLAEDT